jgi:hypothetical protein
MVNGLNWQSSEFTDLVCYKGMQEEKNLTAQLKNKRSAEALFTIYTLSTHFWPYFKNILNNKQNR